MTEETTTLPVSSKLRHLSMDMDKGHSDRVPVLAISTDGHTLYSGCCGSPPSDPFNGYRGPPDNNTVRAWDLATGNCRWVCELNDVGVETLALSADGCVLYSGAAEWLSSALDTAHGRVLRTFDTTSAAAAISADGQIVYAGGGEDPIRVLDTASGNCLRVVDEHTGAWADAIALSADGSTLYSWYQDGTIRAWDTATGLCKRMFKGHSGSGNALALSADESTLFSGGEDKTIRAWNTATGCCQWVVDEHSTVVRALALSTDNRTLYSGADDHICAWNTGSGKCVRVFDRDVHRVNSLALSVDGRTLYSSGGDIRVWDTTDGTLLATLLPLSSPDGRHGFLWTTPPNAVAPHGWLWTDRPDLISVIKEGPDGQQPVVLAEDDPNRIDYLRDFNRQDRVLQRIHDRAGYEREIARLASAPCRTLPPLDLVAIRQRVAAQLSRFELAYYVSYNAKESDTAFDLDVVDVEKRVESAREQLLQSGEWSAISVIGLIEKVRDEKTCLAILTNADSETLGQWIRHEEDKIISIRFRSAVVPDLWSVDLESTFVPSSEMKADAEDYIAQNHPWFLNCGPSMKSKYIDEYLRYKYLPKTDRITDDVARNSALAYLNKRLRIFQCIKHVESGLEIYTRSIGVQEFGVAGGKPNFTRNQGYPLIILEKTDKNQSRILKTPFATSIQKLSSLFESMPDYILPSDLSPAGALARLSLMLQALLNSSDQFTGRIGTGNDYKSQINWMSGLTPPITFPKLLRSLPPTLHLNKRWTVGDVQETLKASWNRVQVLRTSNPPQIRLLGPLYHLTHIDHLTSIAKRGLLSGDHAHSLKLVEHDISDPDVQRWRTSLEPCFKRRISAYVPLFINPSSPMLFRRRALRDELVILHINSSILEESDYVITDGNAASRDTHFSYDPGLLENSWQVLAGQSWNEYPDGRRRRSAEVLVYPAISSEYIVGAYCTNYTVADQIMDKLKICATIEPSVFFWN